MKETHGLVKTTGYDQVQIIKDIIRLHVPGGRIDCDPTFSTGAFYDGTGIERPEFCFDIQPQADGVVKADARHLPLADGSVACMMLDPPFLAARGPSLAVFQPLPEGQPLEGGGRTSGNRINRRFSVYPDEKSLHRMYRDAIREAYRVLEPSGILIFKCQDKVSSGKQYFSHVFVMDTAVEAGFYPKDLFILLAKSRLVADWQRKNQEHARKYHSYFWVFQKSGKHIEYV